MRRTAAAALGLALVAVMRLPAVALAADSTTTTTVAVTTTSAAVPPLDNPVIVAPPSSTTSTTAAHETAPVATPATQAPMAANAHATTAFVDIRTTGCPSFCFTPAQTAIEAGGTVTWTNNSGVDHTVMRCTPSACSGRAGGTGNDPTFSSLDMALPDGKSVNYAFTQPGTYVYYCTLHGYGVMHGTITVTAAVATTTVAVSPGVPSESTTTAAPDPNALASTGGSMNGLIALGALLLVAGLAVVGLNARRQRDR